ncbi:PQ-loop repeat-containing protein [bacterium]|nr:PQ-loop repeat-containing protein [bacterium]
MDVDNISYVFGTLSIIGYSVCYFPQIYTIVKARSSVGISVASILLWTQADVLSLIASILLGLNPTLIAISWYNFAIGIAMTIIIIVYRQKVRTIEIVIAILVTLANLIACIVLNAVWIVDEDSGLILGYITTIVYVLGRFPQIISNYKNKHTGEVSSAMYWCSIFANVCFIVVCLIDPLSIHENMPWILSTLCSGMLDIVVIFQIRYYAFCKIERISTQQTV